MAIVPDPLSKAPPDQTLSLRERSNDTRGASAPGRGPARPETVGRFVVLDVLGEGGFGTVYRARDPQLDREVALKVPREGVLATADERQRFLREARAAANLNHPNICPVYEAGELDGRH